MDKKVRLEGALGKEWHLIDETGKIVLNITDSDLGNHCETANDVLEVIDIIWDEASDAILKGEEFNGVKTEYLDDDWKFSVAKRLFEFYGYDTMLLSRVERFRDEALSLNYSLEDLGILDWYILFEAAQES